ncbi:hypothetical protein [Chitinophaga filiformis]|uniref:Uncharacterized protein n=1 Tax=Chitinophaga filiformis TaxID=104663 RepID=A0A1G7R505_CHIFI|nr:hypothetical protein [Chitinophaga filiformis]SDG05881.1 hypothetical protein SAMN04488121_103322 [Chitinophaga filiformis]
MTNIIQEHWNNDELPGIDAIVFADGTVIILDFYAVSTESGGKLHYVSPLCETTLKSVEKYNDDVWTQIERHPATLTLPDGKKVYFGEGGMGNEGFIALTENDDQLIWALFSSATNPFTKAEFVNGKIRAYSTYDLYYNIDILAPERIVIEAAE